MSSIRRGGALALLVVASVLLTGVGGAGAAAAAGSADCSYPLTVTDSTGEEMTLQEAPERVVTISPSAAQTMWEIGAQDKVVGVTKYADYLEGSSSKANISGPGYQAFVTEKILAQQPDLVLAPNVVRDKSVEALREKGLTVYHFGPAPTFEAIQDKTIRTGELVGACEGAQETVEWMQSELETVRQAVEGEDRPSALYVTGQRNYAAGEGTFIDAMIRAAGGTNLAAAANVTGFKPISSEVVTKRDPEYLIRTEGNPELPDADAYQESTAAKEGNVVVVSADHLNQAAPRTVLVVRKLAKAMHPEAYEEAAATPTPTPTDMGTTASPTPTDDSMGTGTPMSSPTDLGSPGFGPAAVAAAVAGAALVLRRRA